MTPGVFQTTPDGLLSGTIQTEVRDQNGAAKILRMSEYWFVRFMWTVTGGAIPYLGGDFTVKVGVESLGGAVLEGTVFQQTLPTSIGTLSAGTINYDATVTVLKPSDIPNMTPGVYRVVKELLYKGPFGAETVGFVEGEDIEFH
jgi:hypothetical protein